MPLLYVSDNDVTAITLSRTDDPQPDRLVIAFRQDIARLLAEGGRKFVVDLTDVDFMNSTDIGALIGAMRQVAAAHGALIYVGLGLRLADTFSIMRVLDVLPIRLTRREALLELQKLRREPGLMGRLAQLNPSLEVLHQWWDTTLRREVNQRSPVPDAMPPAPLSTPVPKVAVRPASDGQTGQEELATEFGSGGLVSAEAVRMKLWSQGLDIMTRARRLYEGQNLEFSSKMTFEEFLAGLATSLTDSSS